MCHFCRRRTRWAGRKDHRRRGARRYPRGRPAPRRTILPEFASITGDSPGEQPDTGVPEPGSNNWVISRALSATGKPVVANDAHREVALPSMRYIVHLNAPGWNVAGSVEPPFLGVAIGHNDRIGWGLTIVGTNQHDEYTYYTGEAWHARNTHGGIDAQDMAALLKINTEGRLRS